MRYAVSLLVSDVEWDTARKIPACFVCVVIELTVPPTWRGRTDNSPRFQHWGEQLFVHHAFACVPKDILWNLSNRLRGFCDYLIWLFPRAKPKDNVQIKWSQESKVSIALKTIQIYWLDCNWSGVNKFNLCCTNPWRIISPPNNRF